MKIGLCACLLLVACGNPPPDPAAQAKSASPGALASDGERVQPPFEVRGDLDGLLLSWFDAEGAHAAKTRAEIPEAHLAHVRVDSLRIAPDQRLPPDQLYLADLRRPGADGSYPVRLVSRERLEDMLEGAARARAESPGAGQDVILYKASWCGACKAAARFLREHDVAFVEKDIEKDAAANAEMLKKASAAGRTPSGVPVIDFRGTLLFGFDERALTRLIESG